MFKWRKRTETATGQSAAAAGAAAPQAAESGEAERLLRRLEWTVIRRLDGLLQGDYRTLFRGMGIDLADLREYQPHDDVRHIDWNVTARMQSPHVRQFQEDREISAWFLVDLSGSVDFGSGQMSKRELAVSFVAMLAHILSRHGNRVGAMRYRDGVDKLVPAGSGRRHLLGLIESLRLRSPLSRPAGRETDLTVLLKTAHSVLKRRSAVFVISDFIGEPGWEQALGLLARRHEVIAVRLFDPLESALPDLGMVVLEDAETGEQLFLDASDAAFRKRFEREAATREAALREAMSAAGVDCIELSTEEPMDAAVGRFITLRKRRSQLAAGGVLHVR